MKQYDVLVKKSGEGEAEMVCEVFTDSAAAAYAAVKALPGYSHAICCGFVEWTLTAGAWVETAAVGMDGVRA